MDTPLIAGLTGLDLTVLGGVLGALGLLWRLARRIWPVLRKLTHFVDDLVGEPDRPGVPGRPGVMARLAAIEAHGQQTDRRLDGIEHELKPNSGRSLHDQVTKAAAGVARLEASVGEGK